MIEALLVAAHLGTPLGGWNPPKRYDHPYHGKMIVRRVPIDDEPGEFTYAYTYGDTGGICIIYVNSRYTGSLKPILRHERGHCNSWPAHHPK
jgi:hypothetical protein